MERVGPEAFEGTRLPRRGMWAVGFFADWCPFCQEFAPRFAALAATGVHLLIADLTDVESPLWDRFDIEVVPTVIIFRDGASVARVDGISGRGIDDAGQAAITGALGTADPSLTRPHDRKSRPDGGAA